jgi:hypothetical protein
MQGPRGWQSVTPLLEDFKVFGIPELPPVVPALLYGKFAELLISNGVGRNSELVHTQRCLNSNRVVLISNRVGRHAELVHAYRCLNSNRVALISNGVRRHSELVHVYRCFRDTGRIVLQMWRTQRCIILQEQKQAWEKRTLTMYSK